MTCAPRIYFVGAHSTGKTTLARATATRYGLPMVTEVARAVLSEMEVPLERLRTDMDLVDEYQLLVFERQVDAEWARRSTGFVSDRAFDNLAYAAEHSRILRSVTGSGRFKKYIEMFDEDACTVFFVRPHAALLKEDGVRESPTWESINRIDGMVKLVLELHGVRYVNVQTPSMQERTATVDYVLGAKGLRPRSVT